MRFNGSKETQNRPLFRAHAVERYIESREASVLPRFVLPRTLVFLWLLLVLLTLAGYVAWFSQVPIFASGSAVVVESQGSEGALLAAFFSPNNLARLQVDQHLFLTVNDTGERISSLIVAVEPEILSPNAIMQKFDIAAGAASTVTQPAAVVMAQFEPASSGLGASDYLGSFYHAEVEVGSRRIISLLPFLGQFFEE